MSRLATLILWALAAVVASATPAPQLRPWVTGWDEPVDPKRDCRFEREGERLTIIVPGEGHDLDRLEAPRLLRDVQGNFAVEARMRVDAWGPKGARGHRGVGFVVMTDKETAPVKVRFEGLSDHAVRGEVAFPPEHVTYHLKDSRDTKPPQKSSTSACNGGGLFGG